MTNDTNKLIEIAKQHNGDMVEKGDYYFLQSGAVVFNNIEQLQATIDAVTSQAEPISYLDAGYIKQDKGCTFGVITKLLLPGTKLFVRRADTKYPKHTNDDVQTPLTGDYIKRSDVQETVSKHIKESMEIMNIAGFKDTSDLLESIDLDIYKAINNLPSISVNAQTNNGDSYTQELLNSHKRLKDALWKIGHSDGVESIQAQEFELIAVEALSSIPERLKNIKPNNANSIEANSASVEPYAMEMITTLGNLEPRKTLFYFSQIMIDGISKIPEPKHEFKMLYLEAPPSQSVNDALEKAADDIAASIDGIGDRHSYNGTDLTCCEHERIATVIMCENIVRALITKG